LNRKSPDNTVVGLSLFLGVAVTAWLFTDLLSSDAGNRAQALGNVVGALIGTVGAFAVANWTLNRSLEQRASEQEKWIDLIASDLQMLAIAIQSAVTQVNFASYSDGRPTAGQIGPTFIRRLKRHREPYFPWDVLNRSQVRQLEYLELAVDVFLDRYPDDYPLNVPTDDELRARWSQLDHLRTQTSSALELFSYDSVFAKQLKAFTVYEFAPNPGYPYSSRSDEFFELMNGVALEAHRINSK